MVVIGRMCMVVIGLTADRPFVCTSTAECGRWLYPLPACYYPPSSTRRGSDTDSDPSFRQRKRRVRCGSSSRPPTYPGLPRLCSHGAAPGLVAGLRQRPSRTGVLRGGGRIRRANPLQGH